MEQQKTIAVTTDAEQRDGSKLGVERLVSTSSYSTILADPPWPQRMHNLGRRVAGKCVNDGTKARGHLEYPVMTVEDICRLPVADVAATGCHLWLWTTNEFLESGFTVMRAWGFKYLAPIHWIRPTGVGCWFIHRTQTMLFGYKGKCVFPLERFRPNIIETAKPNRHSVKPDQVFSYVESISPGPRLELFAREYGPLFPKRDGWDTWGNELPNDVELKC